MICRVANHQYNADPSITISTPPVPLTIIVSATFPSTQTQTLRIFYLWQNANTAEKAQVGFGPSIKSARQRTHWLWMASRQRSAMD